jgi:hypothetical protein
MKGLLSSYIFQSSFVNGKQSFHMTVCNLVLVFYHNNLLFMQQDIANDLTEQPANGVFMPLEVSQTPGAIPLLARVHLKLGAWRYHLNPLLDDDSVKGSYCTHLYLLSTVIYHELSSSYDIVHAIVNSSDPSIS